MSDDTHGICNCGCGRPTPLAIENYPARGHVKGQPLPFLPGHHLIGRRPEDRLPPGPMETLARVFREVVQVDECWSWTGVLTKSDGKGYGRVTFRGKKYLVHRVVYEAMVAEIPAGLQLDHLCRNRTCVNPWHIEPVTGRINVLRGDNPFARGYRRKRGLPAELAEAATS